MLKSKHRENIDQNMQEAIQRKIIHIDMDAFFAAVEQKDNPSLQGIPVVVGGSPNSRGVVATCSYEARAFGIHSAMPASQAFKLCPQAVFLRPRFSRYQEVSGMIQSIFLEYTDLVEPLSLDEAFLDVTNNKKNIRSATLIAREIKAQIHDRTDLTASAGVSYNKFIAKIASDLNKPDGLTVIPPDQGQAFVEELPIGKFFGIGRATEKKMQSLGIFTGRDLKKHNRSWLVHHFGRAGDFFYLIARGIDYRCINPSRVRKSVGKEKTFSCDIVSLETIENHLADLAHSIEKILFRKDLVAFTTTLKVKYYNFEQITRSITLRNSIQKTEEIIKCARHLLKKTQAGHKKIRLLGLSLSNLQSKKEPSSHEQTRLFPE